MAGIGFRLQKLFQADYFSSRTKAYGYSLFVTAGPWLVVILTITVIRYLISLFYSISIEEQKLFTVSISYCFIFSQIIYGGLQLVVTRYVADLLYEKKLEKVFSSFLGMSKINIFLAFILWSVFAVSTSLPLYYQLLLLVLFLAINMIWVQTIYLTAAKNYQSIAVAFLIGGVVSIAGVLLVAFINPSVNFMYGQAFLLLCCFTFGIVLTLCWLSAVILGMFPKYEREGQFSFLSYLDTFSELFWCGFLYNTGIWICNFITWFGEGSEMVAKSFLFHPIYDSSVFLAYLTIIPTYIFFTVSIETRFYERYKKFIGAINYGGTLNQIEQMKRAMNNTLRQEVERLLRGQGMISLLVIFVGWIIMAQSAYKIQQYSIFQLTVIGAFSNGMVLVNTLLLLYFEDRKGAARTSALFFTANSVLTITLLPIGFDGYGLSFAIGSGIGFLYSVSRLFHYIKDIDYYLFCTSNDRKNKHRFFTKTADKLNRITTK